MADSISQQIKKLIKKKPDISNAELQKAFPGTRDATLKHYKTKFVDELGASAKKSKKVTKANKTEKAKPATKAKKVAAPKIKATAKPKKVAAPKAKATAKPKKAAAPKAKATAKPKKVVAPKAKAPAKPKKVAAPKAKAKAPKSLKEQIFMFLDKKPNTTYNELKKAFKTVSQQTLRGYKASYVKVAKPKKADVLKKKAIPAKKALVVKTATKPELEKRLALMEKQITKLLGEKAGKGGSVKASISAKAKDLEVNLLSFIKEKKKTLDELQNYVTTEVSSFLASIKGKKD